MAVQHPTGPSEPGQALTGVLEEMKELPMRTSVVILTTIALVACTAVPVISDLTTDKVVFQYDGNDTATVQGEAQRGCSIHGRTAVGPISSHCYKPSGFVCYGNEYLFACK
jgi:hypothetical protein